VVVRVCLERAAAELERRAIHTDDADESETREVHWRRAVADGEEGSILVIVRLA